MAHGGPALRFPIRVEPHPAHTRNAPRARFLVKLFKFADLTLLGAAPAFAQIVAGGAHAPSVIQTQNGLDQVNSPTASQLNGALEIAGQRANLIIANPSGISVNGGGFINTTRATLTTGTPNYAADGSVSGFNVTGGNITVSGAGLNAANVDQVDLLARAVQANAAIYAKNLNVVTGANSVDYNTLNAAQIAGDGPAPGVSIDVSNLGGMYANRIVLVGTEQGVGVSLKGVAAAQAGDLILTTQGRLVLAGQTNASGNIVASAHDGIDNSGTTYAQQNVSMSTSGSLTNTATLAAQQNTSIHAGAVASTGTVDAGVNGDGSLAQPGDLSVNASGDVTTMAWVCEWGSAMVTAPVPDPPPTRTLKPSYVHVHRRPARLSCRASGPGASRTRARCRAP